MERASACIAPSTTSPGCHRHGGVWFAVALLFGSLGATAQSADDTAQVLIDGYIDRWRDFYPSQAFAYGDVTSAADFEDFRPARVGEWLIHNVETGRRARALYDKGELTPALETDLLVLMNATANEQADWKVDRKLWAQPQWYAEHISQALTHLLVRDQLSPEARSQAAIVRLRGVVDLCAGARKNLEVGNALRTRRALQVLAGTRAFYAEQLAVTVREWPDGEAVQQAIDAAIDAIADLEVFLENDLLPVAAAPIALGSEVYTQKLMRRSLGSYGPERLAEFARREIREVRELMVDEARRWQRTSTAVDDELDGEALLGHAIEAMENDRQSSAEDFLEEFREQTFAAERFVEEKELATIPKPTTLYVALSPAHFSGAAVGGVYPSGPFAPSADTLFYVPSIPDSAPAAAKDGFYRSFNTHFNTMIISHEMFPGHYLQYKVAVSEAPPIRSLFPNGAYVEGWGSFVEELMLDAGWADNAPLTRLAHLRKRLENATRAYVSVQVHTAAWGEEQVLEFAVKEGLLAPQFARNLWQRVVHSPMQITDYYRGYQRFKALYAARRPDQSTGAWVDAVLRAGPLPITTLEQVLQSLP